MNPVELEALARQIATAAGLPAGAVELVEAGRQLYRARVLDAQFSGGLEAVLLEALEAAKSFGGSAELPDSDYHASDV